LNSDRVAEDNGELEQNRNYQVKKLTWAGLVCNLCLSAIKFICGIVGGSQAVVADAIHSLSDITTDIAILMGIKFWTKPADAEHPHGHHKIETVVTIIIGFILIVVASGLVWNAINTIHGGHETSPGWIAMVAALLSIVVKEILYRWTVRTGRRIRSMPLIANAMHHRSDAFSSIPVVVAVAGAAIEPTWAFLDHIGAVVVSFFIYQAAFKIVKPTLHKLLDSGAPEEDLQKIREIVMDTTGVKSVHGVRTRYLGCSSLAVDLHILVDGEMKVCHGHDISEQVKKRLLRKGPDVLDVIVHLEPFDETNKGG